MAAAGAVIGFSNFWYFPHLLVNHGGSAFLLVYVGCLFLLGFPLMVCEMLIGRRGGFSPINSIRLLIVKDGCDGRWTILGWTTTIVGILILSYLSVIAGWSIAYALRTASGEFAGLTADGVSSRFYKFASDPEKQLFWHSLFVFVTMMINACGLSVGMQRFVKFAVPVFFAIVFVLVLYSLAVSNPADTLPHLFRFNMEALTVDGAYLAAGHALFSLGLGMGVFIVYSTHLDPAESVPVMALKVIVIDTVVGLAAAFIVISFLSAGVLTESSGLALVFQAIPQALDQLPYSRFAGGLFFVALTISAWLTAIALVEPVVSWLVESLGMSRPTAATFCGLFAWALGVIVIFSFNYWSFQADIYGLEIRRGLADILQIVTSYIMIPLAMILTATFAGWGFRRQTLLQELSFLSPVQLTITIWSLRIVIPFIVAWIFYNLYRLNL
jgi:NSS family neurotransmitter:Na+ symporter